MPGWAIGLIVGGGLLLLVVVGLGAFLVSRNSVPTTDQWVTYTDPEGRFTAKFPGQPQLLTESLPNGQSANVLRFETGSDWWEVGWITQSANPHIDGTVYVDENIFMPVAAARIGGEVTLTEPRAHQLMPGEYGEIDGGEIKCQLARTKGFLWIIASSHGGSFEFFRDHMKLSNAARGVEPLQLSYGQWDHGYAEMTRDGFGACEVKGGIPTYKWTVIGKLPPGISAQVSKSGNNDLDMYPRFPHELWYLVGKTGAPGTYKFKVRVVDGDGSTAEVDAVFTVKPPPESVGELQGATYAFQRYEQMEYPAALPSGMRVETHVGLRVGCAWWLVPALQGLHLGPQTVTIDDLPDWMKRDRIVPVDFPNGRDGVIGISPQVGEFKFTVNIATSIPGLSREYRLALEFTIVVNPVPEAEHPESAGAIKLHSGFDIDLQVGKTRPAYIEFEVAKPKNWNDSREWKVERVEWLDVDDVRTKLPPGSRLSVLESPAWPRKPDYVDVYFWPTEAGVWEFELRAKVYIRYVDTPLEVSQKFKCIVKP